MEPTNQTPEETAGKEVVAYNQYRTQIENFKEINSTIVFAYETKKGNAAARSHIAKMRKSKAAVEKVRINETRSSKSMSR